MEKKELCNIIKDLLPSYVEKLTNEETNKFIESHIESCTECKEVLENMRKEIEIISPKEEEKNFKYIKRYSKRLKLFRNILLIIVLVFILIVTRRFIIITDLSKKANIMEKGSNYHMQSECYLSKKIITYEKYNKDDITLTVSKIHYIENAIGDIEYINYKTNIENYYLTNNIEQADELISSKDLSADITNYTLNSYTTLKKLYFALTTSIQDILLSGKKCYLIKIGNTERFIDAETGLTVKFINNDKNQVTDYHYEFGTVTDEDVAKPDTTGYTVINK